MILKRHELFTVSKMPKLTETHPSEALVPKIRAKSNTHFVHTMNIIESIGKTPLVELVKLSKDLPANIYLKAEFFNPLASVKDRIGAAMIEAAELDGSLKPDSVVIEPTSGNTGIALAFVCAAKGYKCILTMPETMSKESSILLLAYLELKSCSLLVLRVWAGQLRRQTSYSSSMETVGSCLNNSTILPIQQFTERQPPRKYGQV